MRRQNQKIIGCMMDLMARFSILGDLVVDFSAGLSAVERACVLLSEPVRFTGCEKLEVVS